jgi:hypothetical protein
MNTVEIIRRICDASEEQLKAIEKILGSNAPACAEATHDVTGYRIKGNNGFAFELSADLSVLTAYRAGKRSPAHDQTLRPMTRGYLRVLIEANGSLVRRSEIERRISLEAGDISGKKYVGRTTIRDAFRYSVFQGGKSRWIYIPLYQTIRKVISWDPEYALPIDRIEVLRQAEKNIPCVLSHPLASSRLVALNSSSNI